MTGGGHQRRHRVRQAGGRIDPHAVGSYWNLAADDQPRHLLRRPHQGRHQRRRTVLLVLGWFPNAKRMKADGHTGRDIAKYLGVSQATLYRYLAMDVA
jgi:Helix-turn-helix domain of resolvase